MKDYPIGDSDINSYIELNKATIQKPGIEDVRAGIGKAHSGFKKVTKTAIGMTITIIIIIVVIFFITLSLMGLLSMSVLDYVKFIIVILLLFGAGLFVYTA
jgi:hypothetical protein